MPVLSLACHLPHNAPHIAWPYNYEQTTKQTKAINNSYIYINISCKCDTNRAGHLTLDAYASRPVACSTLDALASRPVACNVMSFDHVPHPQLDFNGQRHAQGRQRCNRRVLHDPCLLGPSRPTICRLGSRAFKFWSVLLVELARTQKPLKPVSTLAFPDSRII